MEAAGSNSAGQPASPSAIACKRRPRAAGSALSAACSAKAASSRSKPTSDGFRANSAPATRTVTGWEDMASSSASNVRYIPSWSGSGAPAGWEPTATDPGDGSGPERRLPVIQYTAPAITATPISATEV